MIGQLIELNRYNDTDGYLVSMEPGKDIPFEIRRSFYISGVVKNGKRAEHASLNSKFVFVALEGNIRISLSDGINSEEFIITKGNKALYVDVCTWIVADQFSSENAVLLVLSNTSYNKCLYENDYHSFIEHREKYNENSCNRSQ